jgi:hypothetical protein
MTIRSAPGGLSKKCRYRKGYRGTKASDAVWLSFWPSCICTFSGLLSPHNHRCLMAYPACRSPLWTLSPFLCCRAHPDDLLAPTISRPFVPTRQCKRNPCTDKGVFRSTNNGTSWTAVNSGLMSNCVRAFPVVDTTLSAGLPAAKE